MTFLMQMLLPCPARFVPGPAAWLTAPDEIFVKRCSKPLCERRYTTMDTPKCYRGGFRSALRAD